MMHEIFRESPIYEWILQEGEERGVKKGIQLGEERGVEKALKQSRQGIETLAREHFPALLPSIQQRIAEIADFSLLQYVAGKILSAQTEEELLNFLNTLPPQKST